MITFIKRHRIPMKILSFLVCITIMFVVCSMPFYTRAIAPVVAVVAGAAALITLATLLTACGICISQDVDFETALQQIWNSLSDGVKMKITQLSFMVGVVASVKQAIIAEIVAEIGKLIATTIPKNLTSTTSVTMSSIHACQEFTEGQEMNWHTYLSQQFDKVAAIKTYDFSTFKFEWDLQANQTLLTIAPHNGYLYYGFNNISVGTYTGNNKINLCVPTVLHKNDGYSELTFNYFLPYNVQSTQFATQATIGTWRIKNFNNPSLDDGQLVFIGGQICILKNNVYTPISAVGQYKSLNNYLYEVCIGSTEIPVIVYPQYFPNTGTKAIPTTGDVSIRIPATITEAATAVPSDVVVSTSTTAPAVPPSETTDEKANKFKVPAIIQNKFPFCIPFDLYKSFKLLAAPADPPSFDIPFVIPSINFHYTYNLNFEQFSLLAAIMRWFMSLLFIYGLILSTRKLVRG